MFPFVFNTLDVYVYECKYTQICKDVWMYIILYVCICVPLAAWPYYMCMYSYIQSNVYVQTVMDIIFTHTHNFIYI